MHTKPQDNHNTIIINHNPTSRITKQQPRLTPNTQTTLPTNQQTISNNQTIQVAPTQTINQYNHKTTTQTITKQT